MSAFNVTTEKQETQTPGVLSALGHLLVYMPKASKQNAEANIVDIVSKMPKNVGFFDLIMKNVNEFLSFSVDGKGMNDNDKSRAKDVDAWSGETDILKAKTALKARLDILQHHYAVDCAKITEGFDILDSDANGKLDDDQIADGQRMHKELAERTLAFQIAWMNELCTFQEATFNINLPFLWRKYLTGKTKVEVLKNAKQATFADQEVYIRYMTSVTFDAKVLKAGAKAPFTEDKFAKLRLGPQEFINEEGVYFNLENEAGKIARAKEWKVMESLDAKQELEYFCDPAAFAALNVDKNAGKMSCLKMGGYATLVAALGAFWAKAFHCLGKQNGIQGLKPSASLTPTFYVLALLLFCLVGYFSYSA